MQEFFEYPLGFRRFLTLPEFPTRTLYEYIVTNKVHENGMTIRFGLCQIIMGVFDEYYLSIDTLRAAIPFNLTTYQWNVVSYKKNNCYHDNADIDDICLFVR